MDQGVVEEWLSEFKVRGLSLSRHHLHRLSEIVC